MYALCVSVVLQYYELSVQVSKSIMRGNTALLKCSIPSYVKEHISVTSWLQDSTFNIYPSIKGGRSAKSNSVDKPREVGYLIQYPPK